MGCVNDSTYPKYDLVGRKSFDFRCPFTCECNATTFHVDCRSDFYNNVPALPALTRSVYLKGIHVVQNDAFISCPDMNRVQIFTVKSLSDFALTGLSKLLFLQIYGARISKLPNGIFKQTVNLLILNLKSNELRVIPNEPFCQTPHLKRIELDSNKITNLEFGSCFLILRELSYLSFFNNDLHKIEKHVFKNLLNSPLKELHLGNCKIQHISSGAFKYLIHMKTLDISSNELHSIRPNVLLNMKNLIELDLSKNMLYDLNLLNVHFKRLSHVKLTMGFERFPKLNFSIFSPIRKFPLTDLEIVPIDVIHTERYIRNVTSDTFKGFSNLRFLDLTGIMLDQWSLDNTLVGLADNKRSLLVLSLILRVKFLHCNTFNKSNFLNLTSLYLTGFISEIRNKTFHDFPTLTKLQLYRCGLQFIANDAFAGLDNLQHLILRENALTILPVLNLPRLEILDLYYNKLTKLDNGLFRNMQNLTDLVLEENGLEDEDINDKTFSGLINIKRLDLQRNRLRTIFHEKLPFSCLKSLESLRLNQNEITGFKNRTFYDLTNLRFLDISNNDLCYKEHGMRFIFHRLFNLEFLNMRSCGLGVIQNDLFANLTNLKGLALGQNAISSLESGAFKFQHKLRYLELYSNRLSSIDRSPFEGLESLRELHLSDNPFHCSCDLLWFKNWIDSTHGPTYFVDLYEKKSPVYVCASPPDKKGMYLLDFKISESDCVESVYVISTEIIKVAAGVLIPTVLIVCVMIRYRWYLRYYAFLIRSRTKQYASVKMDNYMFDAFVCYHSDDLNWVINNLLPNVEYKQGFKLCLHDRNWLPGVDIAENIVESIELSRKTILVVTNKFAQSRWCQLEASLAQCDGRDVIIMLLLETIQPENMNARLYSIIQSKTYIEWTNNEKGQKLFWKRLRWAIMKPEQRGHVEMITTSTED